MLKEEYEKRYQELADPNILEKIVSCYLPKIVGEEDNVKLLFCACVSKNLPKKNRLSVIITSQSSAGKSNLVNNVLEPFKEDVLDYTDYTPAYLQRSQVDMNGKIFKMEQMERTNDKKQVTLSNLKFLLSEGKLKIGLVDRNEKGRNEPITLEVRGIPVFISTSTNYNIDPETLNRTFLMQIDETEDQTRKITSHTLNDYGTLEINDNWKYELEKLKQYADSYKEFSHQIRDVVIPFAKKLTDVIPTSNITIRRDLQKVLNLACCIAFLHFPNRIKIANLDGENFIEDQWGNTEKRYTYALLVEPSDLKEALEIGGQTIKQTLNKLNKSSMDILKIFQDLVKDNLDGVTIKEIAKATKLSDNRTRELMKQLLDGGYCTRDQTGREFHYYPTDKKFDEISIDNIDFTKEELESWIHNQLDHNSDKFKVLYPENS